MISANAFQPSNVYKSVNTEKKYIALTFDDGPHPAYTQGILDILDQYEIKATFFIVGVNAKQAPETVKEIYNRGHQLGNHTYSHSTPKTSAGWIDEIKKTNDVIFEITGYTPSIFRTPGGIRNKYVENATRKLNMPLILWNVDTRDWAHSSVDEIVSNIKRNTKSGSIILCHDYITKNSPTPQALKKIIPHLLDQGYTFLTINELLQTEDRF